jgi:hypothetical protein
VLAQPLEDLPLALELNAVDSSEGVHPDRQRPGRRDRRVLLAEGPGRRVPRVRRELLA